MVTTPTTATINTPIPMNPIPVANPTAMARNTLLISLALPGRERNRTRLNAPITATPVPRFPFTIMITICTMTGSTARVIRKLRLLWFLYM